MISRSHSQPIRCGAISAFANFDALARGFKHVVSLLPLFDPVEHRQRYGDSSETPNVLNLALRIFTEADDMPEADWTNKMDAFINDRKDLLVPRGVRRVSVVICRRGQYPWYYTLRDMDGVWREEQALRNVEPALALGGRVVFNISVRNHVAGSNW